MTKAELLEENDELLTLLRDVVEEVGSEMSEGLCSRIGEFLDEDEDSE